MTKVQVKKGAAKFAALSFLAVALSACGGFNGREEAQYGASRNHPISVDADIVSTLMPVPFDKIALSVADKAAIEAFASAYRSRGHGPLTLSAPSGSPNERAAISLLAEMRAELKKAGVDGAKVGYAPYRASSANTQAPIIMSYKRYVATASPCGNWTKDYGYNPKNTVSPNFGCATQNNLAAIVADPGDLLGVTAMDPADAARRGIILDKYRTGEVTAADRNEAESGAVSEVDQ